MKQKKTVTVLTFLFLFLCSITQAQVPNGTYTAVNEIAKRLHYAKFDFAGGNKVKGHIGVNGTPLGVVYEFIYTLNGKTLSLSEAGKNGSVEFIYDKVKDQILLSTGVDSYEAVWGKEGTAYEPPKPENPVIPLPTPKKGQLIFLTHGLNDNKGTCFQETVITLLGYDNYHHYGRVSASRVSPDENKSQYINQLTDEGQNVLVRLEFSNATMSFAMQLEEMRKMVAIFHGHNANVVFVGHSMGGLASINYGVEYADTYKNIKKIKIITVSTPFNDNNWAKVGVLKDVLKDGAIETVHKFFTDAKWDLGGLNYALSNLKNKWNKYKGNIADLELHTIGIIGSSDNVKDRENRGDGIIDIDTQLGADWGNISSQDTITRGDNNSAKIDIGDMGDPYHHCNTSNLLKVAERIKEIVEQ